MRIDIFCKVVDNYGDAGFSWRLTRRLTEILSSNHFTVNENKVRLFCDDIPLIKKLAGEAIIAKLMSLGLRIESWDHAEQMIGQNEMPEVVLETFSCDLPELYLAQITDSLLINVEYLSAEPWIEGMHGLVTLPSLPNQHPRYFYYPGFNNRTGGLLGPSEPFSTDANNSKVLNELFKEIRTESTIISIFNYGENNFIDFLDQLMNQGTKADLFICYGKAQEAVTKWLGKPFNRTIDLDQIRLIPTPFVNQEEYDALLARCDLNWVRGEDSFVRAQWVAKPFIWDIYRQENQVHIEKLDAFLNIYLPKDNPQLAQKIINMMKNHTVDTWWNDLSNINSYAQEWANTLLSSQLDADLGVRIINFIKPLLKKG
jgi:uncharacterized repeat protein (TIGR03837 family)